MLVLLSPAKTMTGSSSLSMPPATTPRFEKEASEIALQMTQFSVDELARILKINPKLAIENYRRFQDFHSPDTLPLPALAAYTGVVFKHLNPKDFTSSDFLFTQQHLRIASFCYGLLRPLDAIKPYRMEADIKLPELGDGTLYPFWRSRQTDTLIDDARTAGRVLIYLASMDIQPAFDWKRVEQSVRVITPEFKVRQGDTLKTIVVYAKMARGQMSRYILRNKIDDPEQLKDFTWEGFSYHPDASRKDNWLFLQEG